MERERELGDLQEVAVVERIDDGVDLGEDEPVALADRPVDDVRRAVGADGLAARTLPARHEQAVGRATVLFK